MSNHKRRPLNLLNHIRDRKCLAAARDPKQNLVFFTIVQICNKLFDCLGLVALRRIFRNETELHTLIIKQKARS